MTLIFPTVVIIKESCALRQFVRGMQKTDEVNGTGTGLEFNVTVCSADVQYGHSTADSKNIGTHGPSSSEFFKLHLVSRDTGKPTIAAVTDSLLRRAADRSRRNAVSADRDVDMFKISVSDLQAMLEGMRR